MSLITPGYTVRITLLDKTEINRTVIPVAGDSSDGNLTRHRKFGTYSFTGVRKNRHGTITLRAKNGLFVSVGPTLIRPEDFALYLLEVQVFQHTKQGDIGHPNPLGRVGEMVRYEISTPVQDADEKGQLLTLSLQAIETRMRVNLDSETHRLEDPKGSTERRLSHYSLTRGTGSPLIFFLGGNIDLPANQFLNQDWKIGGQKVTWDILVDIIDKLSKPAVVGGNFKDQYFYFVNDPTITNTVEVFAEEFGKRSSGVVLNPLRPIKTDTYSKKHTLITENVNFRNLAIVRGKNGKHAIPMAFTRFASDVSHAKISDAWDAGIPYIAGDFVRFTLAGITNIFKCILDIVLPPVDIPPNDGAHWENLSTATRHTPWTTNVDIWKAMGDKDDPTGDGFYETMFHDFNIVAPNYDRADDFNEFESVSLKDVDFTVNDPTDTAQIPANQIHNGKRVLVGTAPVGVFAGQDNKVAQYFDNDLDPAEWKFSLAPIEDDTINHRGLAQVLRFVAGVWTVAWDLTINPGTTSPFYPVKSITLVDGPDGVPNSAVQFLFDWNEQANSGNLASRRAGFVFKFPAVPRDKGAQTVGNLIATPTLDFENLSKNPVTGETSDYNAGLGTEDLGTLRGVSCKMEINFRDIAGLSVNGMTQIPMIWAFRDLFDRVLYVETKLRINGKWGTVQFEAGPNAKMQLHDDRTDELFKLLGYTFPHNFFLQEKEYSGVRFDWNFVKEIQCFWKGSYDDNFFYKASQNLYLDRFTLHLQQAAAQLAIFTFGLVPVPTFITDNVTLKISQFRFHKDAIVSTATGVTPDARMLKVDSNEFDDYITLQGIGSGALARAQHYPQFTPIDAYFDARIRFGETFELSGPTVEGSPKELTCAEYTIFDGEGGDGLRMQVLGYNKFEGDF